MYITSPIQQYLDELSAKQPTPGGGSASALTGALGTSLLEMACNFTVNNDKYKDVHEDIKNHIESLKNVRKELTALIDEDVRIYSEIRDAFKTKNEKLIDKALRSGYDISLKICELSKNALNIALDLSEKGNINLITDIGCGAELLNAAFNSGIFNCSVNLNGIKDKSFTEKEKSVIRILKKETKSIYTETIVKVG